MSRPTPTELREYIDLMTEKKVVQVKLDGIEITLHPVALQAPMPAPRPRTGEPASIDPEPEKNPLRTGLRELAMREQINGRDVDEEIEFPPAPDPFES